MTFIKSQLSPIDLAVQSLTSFTGLRTSNDQDWHCQFAANIDEEDFSQPQRFSSKRESPGDDLTTQQIQPESALQQDREQPEDVQSTKSSTGINQQSLQKFTPFVRPSSHGDTSPSFTFDKPQPKQLDFSRKKAQDFQSSVAVTKPEPTSNAHILPEPRPSSILNPKGAEAAKIDEARYVADEPDNPLPSISASPTLVATVPDPGNPSCHECVSTAPQQSNAQAAIARDRQRSPVAAPKTIGVNQRIPRESPQNIGTPVVATLLSSPCLSAKITKRRRKAKGSADSDLLRKLKPEEADASLSYEDTLGVLSMLYRKDQLQREKERAALKAKEIELQDLREISNAIYSQLQQVRQREKSQEAELSRFRKTKPQWEIRVKKLSDYVQSLADDHKALKDGAQKIQEQQEILQANKSDLASALKTVQDTVEHDHGKTKKVLIDVRHHMEMLEQTVTIQERQLQQDADLLDTERLRSQRLEAEISKVANGHEHLRELVTDDRLNILGKLDDLLCRSGELQVVTSASSQNYVKPLIDEAISLLKGIQNAEIVKPDDIRRLDVSIRSYADRIAGSVQACEQAVTVTAADQKGFASEFQERLQALNASIAGEHALNERVTDLREVKATLKERLQAAETAMADARRKSIALQSKNELQLQKISALEIEAANLRNRPKESLHTALHVHELEIQNKGLSERSSNLHKHTADISEKLQQKIEEAVGVESRLNDLQIQLKEAQAEKVTLEEKALAYEEQANAKLERTKKELWKAANLEKVRIESNYQNQLHQLKQHKKEVDAELEQRVGQVSQLQADLERKISQVGQLQDWKTEAEAKTEQNSSLLADLQAEKVEGSKASATFQAQAAELEIEARRKDEHLAQLKEELRLVKNDLKIKDADIQRLGHAEEKLRVTTDQLNAKEAQIQRLTVANALSSEKELLEACNLNDQENSKRKANRAEKRLPSVVDDSQPNDIQISAAIKPASTKSARTSTPLRYGRLTDIAGVSSPLEDLDYMLDDLGDLAEIFSPRTLPKPQDSDPAKKVTSRDMPISRGKRKEDVSPTRQLTASHDSRSTIHRSTHFSVPKMRPTFTATSSISQAHHDDISTQGSTQNTDDIQRQQIVSMQSSRQHSILKKSATVEKRPASVAGLSPSGSRSRNKRTRDLGPVIEDSQSPRGSRIPARNHRPTKMNSRKQPKDDKYSRRFSRELNPEL